MVQRQQIHQSQLMEVRRKERGRTERERKKERKKIMESSRSGGSASEFVFRRHLKYCIQYDPSSEW